MGQEACYPYPNGPISACIDSNPVKILSSTRITSDAQAKDWLSTRGAIQAAMYVPEGLFNYTGGVFKDDGSPVAGQHAVCIVGFDDAKGCWIVKNSWGSGWGEQGWFRVAYGQCGIFRKYAAYGYTVSFAPAPGPQPTPVPPTPVPETGDIVLPAAGVVSIMSGIRGETGLNWILNGAVKGLIKTMAAGYTSLGSFDQGTGLTFGLDDESRPEVSLYQGPADWRLQPDLDPAHGNDRHYAVSFLVKLDVAGEENDTTSEEAAFSAIQLGDETMEENILAEPDFNGIQFGQGFYDHARLPRRLCAALLDLRARCLVGANVAASNCQRDLGFTHRGEHNGRSLVCDKRHHHCLRWISCQTQAVTRGGRSKSRRT